MAKQSINRGLTANDGTGDNLRDAAGKINDNIDEVYNAIGDGANVKNLVTNNVLDVPGANRVAALFATTGDLPPASNYHGMFAHVHSEGKGYFAHGGVWVELVDVNSSIGKLGDVDTSGSGPTTGQVLKWAGSSWVPADDTDTQLALSGASVGDLGNVDLTNLADNSILKYDNTAGKFVCELEAGAQTVNGLSDVDTTGVLDGDTLVYDNANQRYNAGKPTYNLTNLQDVDTAGASNGALLSYDGGTGNWIPTTSQQVILTNMDTATRDAISDVGNGMIIYNTDTNKAQVYANSAWVDLH